MRTRLSRLALITLLSVACTASAFDESTASTSSAEAQLQLGTRRLLKRDGHHHHGTAPLLELNETEVTLYHETTPPSYYTIDWEDPLQASARYPSLIVTHGIFMALAFFVFLPMGKKVLVIFQETCG